MARGAPDYSNVRSGESLHRLDDLAEIPPRFGQIVSIDRSGYVVAAEDFRYGIGMLESTNAGLGESLSASPLYSRFGGFTAKMSRVANASSFINASIYAPSLESDRLGLEVQFSSDGGLPKVILFFARYTGSVRLLWGLKWNDADDKIYIGGDTVGWTEIKSGRDISQVGQRYHNVKLVVDVENENYERVIVDGENISVAEVAPLETTTPVSPHIVATITNSTGQASANNIYVDYIIITRDEP